MSNLQTMYYPYLSGGLPGSGSIGARALPPVSETMAPDMVEHTGFAPPTHDGLARLPAFSDELPSGSRPPSVARSASSGALQLLRGTVADRLAHPLDYTIMRNTNRFAYEANEGSEYGGSRAPSTAGGGAASTKADSVQAMKRRVLEVQRDELQAELDRVDSRLARAGNSTSLASVSTATTSWRLMHRTSKQYLAPSLSDSWRGGADRPSLPKPATNLPKPGDFFRVMAANQAAAEAAAAKAAVASQ